MWQLLARFCATFLIPDRDLRLVGKSQPSSSVSLYLLSLLSLYQGIETIQTKGTRDGSDNLHHLRPSATYSITPSLTAPL